MFFTPSLNPPVTTSENSLANRLTALSNYYIDWSRVGELLASGRHRYTFNQLLPRAFIGVSSIVGAGLGYYWSTSLDKENDWTKEFYTLAGFTITAIVTHTLVILPLIYKRLQMEKECKSLQYAILASLHALQVIMIANHCQVADLELLSIIAQKIPVILNSNLSDAMHARASQTWGRRLRLLKELHEQLIQDIECITKTPCEKTNEIIQEKITVWQTAFQLEGGQEFTPSF